jgi:hypothetical protein
MVSPRVVTPLDRKSALAIAFVADALQLAVMPLFGFGWIAPVSDALDVVVAFLLIRRLGWHVAFLPSFVVELLPVVDLFPTWTAAAWFVGRTRVTPRSEIGEVRDESS